MANKTLSETLADLADGARVFEAAGATQTIQSSQWDTLARQVAKLEHERDAALDRARKAEKKWSTIRKRDRAAVQRISKGAH